MSRFYGDLTGQAKTKATRRGSLKSGVESHVRGWNVGVRVVISDEHGKDYIRVYKTGGSNNPSGELVYTCESEAAK